MTTFKCPKCKNEELLFHFTNLNGDEFINCYFECDKCGFTTSKVAGINLEKILEELSQKYSLEKSEGSKRKEEIAEKLFMDQFDCYADNGKSGFKTDQDIPAMTKEKFIEIVKNLL